MRTLLALALPICVLLLAGCGGGSPRLAPPSDLRAVPGDARISLRWTASTGAERYRVQRGTSHGGPYGDAATLASTSFVDTGLTNGKMYYYVVTASNQTGESRPSGEVSGAPRAETAEPAAKPSEQAGGNLVGMNTWFLNDWDGSLAFVDAMKHARPWRDALDWHRPVAGTDARGWPTSDASTVVISGRPDQINGTYTLVFEGQADVSLMWAEGSVSQKTYDPATNTTRARVTYAMTRTAPVGLVFENTRRTPDSPLRSGFANVRLYRPGYPADGSQVFTRPFLEAMSGAQVVRMMEWTMTNMNMVQRWADRQSPRTAPRVTAPYRGPRGRVVNDWERGVALEHQIQLCNALHADCWINVPVLADDEYVRKMALAIRYGTDGTEPYTAPRADPVFPPLDPGLRVYVEYANEIWNGGRGFECQGVLEDLVGALPASHPVQTPPEGNIWVRVWRYAAYRIAAVSDIFRSVYGDAAMGSAVRPLLMTQQGNGQGMLDAGLTWLDHYARRQAPARSVRDYIYGAGGSAYYGPWTMPPDRNDLDAIFAVSNFGSAEQLRNMSIDSVWAASYGLRHVAYEGGPSLDPFSEEEARRINADPRVRQAILRMHDAWSALGGDLLAYYAIHGPAQWEFTSNLANPTDPKINAFRELLRRRRAPVSLGSRLPGRLLARDRSDLLIRTGESWEAPCGRDRCSWGNDAGEMVALPGHAPRAFDGMLTVRAASSGPTEVDVWVNGVLQGRIAIHSPDRFVDSTPLGVRIPEGLVGIRLEVVRGQMALHSITVR